MKLILCSVLLTFAMASCPQSRLKGGKSGHVSGTNGASQVSLVQPENPAQAAAQDFEKTTETSMPIPALSKVTETIPSTKPNTPPVVRETVPSAPTVMVSKTTEKSQTHIGAAQKDMGREISAKMASMSSIRWVGILLILAALAMFHPAVALTVGSRTLQAMTGVAGMVLIFGSSVLVGNEVLVIILVAAGLLLYFFAHRHGRLQQFFDSAVRGIPKP